MSDIAALRAALEAAGRPPPRAGRKPARSLAHAALPLEQAGALTDPDAIDLAPGALSAGAGVHGCPQTSHMARARLRQARGDLPGLPEPVIAA